LCEPDAQCGQAFVFALDVIDGERRERNPIPDKCVLERLDRGALIGLQDQLDPSGSSGETTVSQRCVP
jgi:hypothetical protein